VRLSPVGTSATIWPIVSALDDGWWWCGEQSVVWLMGETEVLGENLPQCHYVHYKSHVTWPRLEHTHAHAHIHTHSLPLSLQNVFNYFNVFSLQWEFIFSFEMWHKLLLATVQCSTWIIAPWLCFGTTIQAEQVAINIRAAFVYNGSAVLKTEWACLKRNFSCENTANSFCFHLYTCVFQVSYFYFHTTRTWHEFQNTLAQRQERILDKTD
jgi:hypothetical protein